MNGDTLKPSSDLDEEMAGDCAGQPFKVGLKALRLRNVYLPKHRRQRVSRLGNEQCSNSKRYIGLGKATCSSAFRVFPATLCSPLQIEFANTGSVGTIQAAMTKASR